MEEIFKAYFKIIEGKLIPALVKHGFSEVKTVSEKDKYGGYAKSVYFQKDDVGLIIILHSGQDGSFSIDFYDNQIPLADNGISFDEMEKYSYVTLSGLAKEIYRKDKARLSVNRVIFAERNDAEFTELIAKSMSFLETNGKNILDGNNKDISALQKIMHARARKIQDTMLE